jgi:predicted Fe-Mo cluster-binding NifX family protein
MRISIPSMGNKGLEDIVGQHFGRVPYYVIFDTETEKVETIDNISTHMGGSGYPPELLHAHKVDIMLCSGLGQRAVSMFEQLGIEVFVGATGTVQNAIDAWRRGELQAVTDETVCRERRYHRH